MLTQPALKGGLQSMFAPNAVTTSGLKDSTLTKKMELDTGLKMEYLPDMKKARYQMDKPKTVWRPMSEAPKYGTPIIAQSTYNYVVQVHSIEDNKCWHEVLRNHYYYASELKGWMPIPPFDLESEVKA